MKNKISVYISLLFLGVLANSCSKDFLELNPIAAENEAAFYRTMQHADEALIACYSQFNNTAIWDRNLIMTMGDVCSDDAEAGGDNVNEVPGIEMFNYLNPELTNGNLSETYASLYRGINFANIAISKLPQIEETDPNVDVDLLRKRIAEAKFIRAINHFYLAMVFGEIPVVDKVLAGSEYQRERSSFREIYDLIEKDLKEAMAVLPEKGGWNGEEGRATKGAAQALLAKMLIFESSYAKYYGSSDARFSQLKERWQEALTLCEDIMAAGKYKLVGIEGETYETWRGPATDGYRYIFTSEGDYSPETVFEITCIQEGLGNQGARGHALAKWTTARYYYDNDSVKRSTDYWGLGLPHPDLVKAFDPGDPRLRTSIAFPGNADTIQIRGSMNFRMCFDNSITKTYQKKWENSSVEFIDWSNEWMHAPSNVKLIRYSDVYLMAAEAALALNQNDKALGYLNKVRERARMCGNSGQPAAKTSIALADIIHERRLEFCGEGHRFFDIVRWNIAYDLLNKPTYSDFGDRRFVRGKNEFQPLPQRQIDLSGGLLKQYPGW
jgi:starch-binding outer membrane protein, SusD/RagB family